MLLPPDSRMKDTPLLSVDGNPMFGLFIPPAEFENDPDASQAALNGGESPFIDILAFREYGPGNEKLWWIIAYATGMVDIDRDVDAGTVYTVPSVDAVTAFRSRSPANE